MSRTKQLTDIDLGFFKKISRDSAWVYGWLVTDGYIDYKRSHIKLQLKSTDCDVLIKIKNKMQFSGDIRYEARSDGRESATLRICRKSVCNDLYALGMPKENKSYNTTFPKNLPEEFYWDFVRGVFEGDGSIARNKGNTDDIRVSICGVTESFIDELAFTLGNRGIRTSKDKLKNGVYSLRTKANFDALRMCYFMYNNTTNYDRLDRKFEVYKEYLGNYYSIKRKSVPSIELVELGLKNIK